MIEVVVDDLAFLAVDAILRPASERLDPVTPAMSRLDHAAGPGFADQRRIQTALDIGAAVVTGAGDLAAKLVVHVVIQGEDRAATPDSVRRGLLSAWQRAEDWGLEAVAMPLIGAGAGQLSLEDATTILIQTLEQHRTRARFPTLVRIVLEREPERAAVAAVVARRPS